MIILSGPGRPQSEFACRCAGCGRSFYPTEEAVAEVDDLEPDVLFVPVCALLYEAHQGRRADPGFTGGVRVAGDSPCEPHSGCPRSIAEAGDGRLAAMNPLAYLEAIPQWIFVMLVPLPYGKTDKIPCHGRTGAVGVNAHDPSNWATHAEAAALAQTMGPNFVLGFDITDIDDVWCVDLDSCLGDDGAWSPLALDVLRRLPGAAVEVSQSGRGLHVWPGTDPEASVEEHQAAHGVLLTR